MFLHQLSKWHLDEYECELISFSLIDICDIELNWMSAFSALNKHLLTNYWAIICSQWGGQILKQLIQCFNSYQTCLIYSRTKVRGHRFFCLLAINCRESLLYLSSKLLKQIACFVSLAGRKGVDSWFRSLSQGFWCLETMSGCVWLIGQLAGHA